MPDTAGRENLTLCMGSACHQQGVFKVVEQLKQLIANHHLEDAIEIKGAFCLDRCGQGVVMKYRGKYFRNISPQNIATVFMQEILPNLPERK